jgi:hypothetical protein
MVKGRFRKCVVRLRRASNLVELDPCSENIFILDARAAQGRHTISIKNLLILSSVPRNLNCVSSLRSRPTINKLYEVRPVTTHCGSFDSSANQFGICLHVGRQPMIVA